MKFSSILVRLDEESLSIFLSRSAFAVLKNLDPDLVRLESLAKLVDDKIPKSEILRDSDMRNIVFGVLHQNEASLLLDRLGEDHYDNAIKILKEISFRKNSKNEEILFEYFETKVPEKIPTVRNSPNPIIPNHSLFDYQYEVMDQIKKHLDKDGRALLHMPTGAGKTRTAMRIVTSYMLESKPVLVIWLAYNEELCKQALSEFNNAWTSIGDRNTVKAISFFSNINTDILLETKEHEGIFLAATLSKIHNTASRNPNFLAKLADRVSLVVFDEAHQVIATTYKSVTKQLVEKNDGVKLLGLSATPGRTDDSEELAKFFRYNKATINDPNPVDFLIKQGYLAKPHTDIIPYDMNELTAEEKKALSASYEIPSEILAKLATEEKRNILIIHTIENLITEKHKRIIVFGATVKHAQDIAIILTARSHRAYYVTTDTPKDVRKDILNDFLTDDDDAKILCNYGVLKMGFDAPKTSAVVIARPTKSLVLYSQMVGRATRGPKAKGTKHCTIKTVVDSSLKDSISMPDAFLNWEEIWK